MPQRDVVSSLADAVPTDIENGERRGESDRSKFGMHRVNPGNRVHEMRIRGGAGVETTSVQLRAGRIIGMGQL